MSFVRPLARLLVAPAFALTLATAAPALAHDGLGDKATNVRAAQVATQGTGHNMAWVANLQYDGSGQIQDGTDIEFVRVDGRDYALAGTKSKGMQIIDITRPRYPKRVAVYDCKISQGDIQVWRFKARVLAAYTADGTFGAAGAASRCARDLDLGADAAGTIIVDITRPASPRTLSYLPVPKGSHNMTVHPSGRYLYNSNSDLINSIDPAVTIFDITQPWAPKKVQDYPLPFVPLSLGSESHDITFNASGTRAYVAAISQTLILDTTDPRNPKQIGQILDPSINVVHQSDPVTLARPDGTKRTLLVITDEVAGAEPGSVCPGGGLHIYDITGAKEKSPVKVGAWFIDAVSAKAATTCTAHVLRIYPRQKLLTIAWYTQGVRVLDISGLATVTGGRDAVAFGSGVGMKEVGSYTMPDSDTWAFKTNRINRDGSFFGYGNDQARGFDVYRFKGLNRSVPALVPVNIVTTPDSVSSNLVQSGMVVVPAGLLALLLHRRRSRKVAPAA